MVPYSAKQRRTNFKLRCGKRQKVVLASCFAVPCGKTLLLLYLFLVSTHTFSVLYCVHFSNTVVSFSSVEESRDIQYGIHPDRFFCVHPFLTSHSIQTSRLVTGKLRRRFAGRPIRSTDEPIFCWDVVVWLLLSTGSLLSTTNVTTKIIPRFVGDSATRPIEWHYLALPFREERSHRSPSALAVLVLFGAIIPEVSSSAAI